MVITKHRNERTFSITEKYAHITWMYFLSIDKHGDMIVEVSANNDKVFFFSVEVKEIYSYRDFKKTVKELKSIILGSDLYRFNFA